VLGKHSGTRGVIHAYQQMGLSVTRTQAQALLMQVRRFVTESKHSPNAVDLNRFHQNL
jgi:homocitrate synthase NifV